MKTIIKKIDKNRIDKTALTEAGEILKAGGLVAFPTETVYGLGADALNEKAAEKIYAAKGRPSDNPLIVHITDMDALQKIVSNVPDIAAAVAEKYWPGPLTMIFDKTEAVPYGTTGGLETVAVRMPSDETARQIIEAGGGYIAAPSANTSGRPSPTSAQHVAEDLTGKIEMIVDGGSVDIGVESTILDMTVTPPMILRPGAVTKEMLEELIGEVAVDTTLITADSDKAPKAPGMKYRHYAPKAELSIFEGPIDKVILTINEMTAQRIKEGCKVGIIGTEETVACYKCGDIKSIGSRQDEMTIAASLYRLLREFDDDGVQYIYSESFATGGIGSAIMNRLLKAAGHHVINLKKNQEEIKMPKVHVMDHPLIQHKITCIRREEIGSRDFRAIVGEIAALMCYEATRDLKLQDVKIKTPICEMIGKELSGKKLAVVPILRAGLGMVDGMLNMIPAAKVGHIGLYRDPETLEPVEYYCKLPSDSDEREVFVVDPMLATGGSSIAAIQLLKDKGVKNIRFMCIIAAPEGVERMTKEHPDVDLYIGALDDHLNEHAYIVPGLGDAGDRIFGTK